VAPLLVGLALAGLHARFADYYAGTRWLVWLLGPSVTAFAVPIHDQWPLVRRYWRVLLLGIAAGSATALVSGWALASLLRSTVRCGCCCRVRQHALCHAIVFHHRRRSGIDRARGGDRRAGRGDRRGAAGAPAAAHRNRPGAMFGVGAHAAGTAHIQRISPRLGALSGLTMVLTGALNVVAAP
jgi:putative effector of murein hydrolase